MAFGEEQGKIFWNYYCL